MLSSRDIPRSASLRLDRLLLGTALLLLVSCAPGSPPSATETEEDGLQVAATVPPHAWLVEQVAGPHADVIAFLPPGASPHAHLPTDAEISRLARCRVFFRSGVPIENGAWLSSLRSAGVDLVDLRTDRAPEGDAPDGSVHEDEHDDPHTWLSPRRLRSQARIVEAELRQRLPGAGDDLSRRTDDLVRRLDRLDDELAQRLASYRGRDFFVYHPSWTHFADDYGLVQVAVEEGGAAPSDAQIAALRRRLAAAEARILFVDPRNAGSGARALAATLDLELRPLDPLARDVPTLLRHAADDLIRSWQPR